MTLPLALTMGEPAGIGGEIALKAWLRRRDSALPPFYVIDDPARLIRLAGTLGCDVPVRPVETTEQALSTFADALPVRVSAVRTDPWNIESNGS